MSRCHACATRTTTAAWIEPKTSDVVVGHDSAARLRTFHVFCFFFRLSHRNPLARTTIMATATVFTSGTVPRDRSRRLHAARPTVVKTIPIRSRRHKRAAPRSSSVSPLPSRHQPRQRSPSVPNMNAFVLHTALVCLGESARGPHVSRRRVPAEERLSGRRSRRLRSKGFYVLSAAVFFLSPRHFRSRSVVRFVVVPVVTFATSKFYALISCDVGLFFCYFFNIFTRRT